MGQDLTEHMGVPRRGWGEGKVPPSPCVDHEIDEDKFKR